MLPPAGNFLDSDDFTPADGINLLEHIEWCARISHRSEDAVTNESWKRIIQAVVLDHGDWSVVEHASVSVDAYVDRGITHEWVRHRLFSYTQESTRFVNYEKKMRPSFIYPDPKVECIWCLQGKQDETVPAEVFFDQGSKSWQHTILLSDGKTHKLDACRYHPQWLFGIEAVEVAYKQLIANKWAPQLARSVFPNALASRIIVTGNLRNWRHFFIMRTSKETHPQMKQVTIPLLKEFQEKIPMLFDDIVPEQKQSEAMKKAR